MKIIKEGIELSEAITTIPFDSHIRICHHCSCVYSYEHMDMNETFDRMGKIKYLTCPYCKRNEDI